MGDNKKNPRGEFISKKYRDNRTDVKGQQQYDRFQMNQSGKGRAPNCHFGKDCRRINCGYYHPMGRNSDSRRPSRGNQYNNRGNRDRRGNQYGSRNYYGNNGNRNQQQRNSINTIIDSALKTAKENGTDTVQPDAGNMFMSINTFSI